MKHLYTLIFFHSFFISNLVYSSSPPPLLSTVWHKKTIIFYSKSMDLETIMEIYDDVHNLPVSQMLNLLDELVDEFDDFSIHYELHNQKLSWYAWFTAYWWSIPTMIGKIMFVCLTHLQSLGLIKK